MSEFSLRNISSFWLTVVIFFSTAIAFWNYQHREYGWDLPGYLGSHYTLENLHPKTVHQRVYAEMTENGSPRDIFFLKGLDDPKHATYIFARDYHSFTEQLPYYQVKILYNALISFVTQFGIDAVDSPLVVNAILSVVLGILLFMAFNQIFHPNRWLSFLFTMMILVLPPFRYMGYVASPDLLSVVFLVAFMYAVFRKFSDLYIFLLLLLLILSRPDFVIFGVSYYMFLIVVSIWEHKNIAIKYFVCPTVLAAVYYSVVQYYHYPGWKDVFYDSFIHRRHYISKESAHFTFQQYMNVVLQNLIYMKKVGIIALSALFVALWKSKTIWQRLFSIFLFVNLILKFMFFPAAGEYRFFAGILLISVLWALQALFSKSGFSQNKVQKSEMLDE